MITIFVRSCFNLEPDDSQRNSSPYCYSYMHLSYLNLLCQSQGVGYSITNLNQLMLDLHVKGRFCGGGVVKGDPIPTLFFLYYVIYNLKKLLYSALT